MYVAEAVMPPALVFTGLGNRTDPVVEDQTDRRTDLTVSRNPASSPPAVADPPGTLVRGSAGPAVAARRDRP